MACYYFFSWMLWKHFLHPPESPVFWRTIKQGPNRFASQLGLALLATSIMSYSISGYFTQFSVSFSIIILIALAIFSCSYLVIWIASISSTIAGEHRQATYDLICMTPSGAIGMNWALATGILHRNDMLNWIDFGRKLLSGLILLILLMVLVAISVHKGWNNIFEPLQLFFDVIFLTILSYIDHVQSVVLGVLIAMLIPITVRNVTDVHIWSVFIFMTLQVIMLTLFLVVSVLFPPYVKANHWQVSPIIPMLLLLYTMRESCIYIAWKVLSHQLNAEIYDLGEI